MKTGISTLFFLIIATGILLPQTPSTLSLQGVLRDATGNATADGDYAMVFKIYDVLTGGTALWTESQTINVNNGVYNAQLGSVNTFGSLAFDRQYYVGVTVGGTELSPRMVLTAAPYAMGFKGTTNIFSGGGNVGINTTSPTEKLEVNGNIKVTGTGNVTAEGALNAAGVTATGAVNCSTITSTGAVNGGSFTTSNAVNAGSVVASGNVRGATVTSTGALSAGSISSGAVSSGSISASGTISATGNITANNKTTAVCDVPVRIVAGLINTNSTTPLFTTGGFSLSKSGYGTGRIQVIFDSGVTIYSVQLTVALSGLSNDFRFFVYASYYSSNYFVINTQFAGEEGFASTPLVYMTAIISR